MNRLLIVITTAGICTGSLFAQDRFNYLLGAELPHIRATGEATVTAVPDHAKVEIGVAAEALSAKEAAVTSLRALNALVSVLHKKLGDGAEISTRNYAATPIYNSPREGITPRITGYRASNVVEVRTSDVKLVRRVADLAAQSDANTIESVQFTLDDDQAVRAQALQQATANSYVNALAVANSMRMRVANIQSMEENVDNNAPLPKAAPLRGPPVSIDPGVIEFHASVAVNYQIEPRY